MGTHTVRLEPVAEQALKEVQESTKLTVSAALKRGLFALRDELAERETASPFAIYSQLDLGEGGDALGSAGTAKKTLRKLLQKKHKR